MAESATGLSQRYSTGSSAVVFRGNQGVIVESSEFPLSKLFLFNLKSLFKTGYRFILGYFRCFLSIISLIYSNVFQFLLRSPLSIFKR